MQFHWALGQCHLGLGLVPPGLCPSLAGRKAGGTPHSHTLILKPRTGQVKETGLKSRNSALGSS